ncbi:MAG: phage tail protein [Leptolyngbya sp. UWPOB_LEPTO1]|uniref:phage tail protein n=1 Tax=Leptolyngbya sp. UWPOB_LEPTO1 TaxID=2815653 RepID=UPI001ACFBD1A|nr:phage tail protein [Leptolyngbya sp. UWPOB_LEPTO1]MBN8562715.1 phage tail protein [Leptolyngbya sp. UWPOB_LEPTO1]
MAGFPEILTTCRFYLELRLDGSKDSVDGYFLECSGFKSSQQVIETNHVTPQKWGAQGKAVGRIVGTKIPGNVSYSNLVLRRGLTCSMTFWNWIAAVQDGNWATQRRNGSLIIFNQAAEEQFRLEFQGAFPMGYRILDVNARGDEMEVEEIEVAVEELKRVKVANGDAS